MRKIFASILTITMVLATLSTSVIPVSAETNLPFEAITETFEGYKEENWISKLNSNVVTDVENMGENTWQIFGAAATDGAFVGVDKDPVVGGTRGKVLKIDLNNLPKGTSAQWLQVRRNVNKGSKVSRTKLSVGKKLVFEADTYFPTDRLGASESPVMNWSTGTPTSAAGKTHLGVATYGKKAGKRAIVTGLGYNKEGFARSSVSNTEKWETTKFIIDVSENASATHLADTTRMLIDGRLQTIAVGTEALPDPTGKINPAFKAKQGDRIIDTWHSAFADLGDGTLASKYSDLYGVVFGNGIYAASNNVNGNTAYYVDNLKIYWIDTFKQEGTITYGEVDATGRWYDGAIAIPFNNKIKETVEVHEYSGSSTQTLAKAESKTYTLSDLVRVLDSEGNERAGVVATVSEDGKTLLVTPPKGLTENETYSIVVDTRFSDVNGQGLWTSGSADETKKIAEFTMGANPFAHIYFDEDFEDYTDTTSNWLANKDSNGYVKLAGLEENAWRVGGTGTYTNGVVKVSTDPLNSGRGNVLEINSGTVETDKSVTVLKTSNGTSPVTKESLKGKRVVIEGDVYLPTTMAVKEETVLSYYGQQKINVSRGSSNQFIIPYTSNSSEGKLYVIGGGTYNTISGTRYKYNAGGQWHKYRYVIDVSEDVSSTHVDTVRGYVDGKLITKKTGEGTNAVTEIPEYPLYEADGSYRVITDHWKRTGDIFAASDDWKSAGDFYGMYMAVRQNTSTNQSYYVDNIKAYFIDSLTMKAPDLSNYTGGAITLSFNQPIAESVETMGDVKKTYGLSDMFTLTDADGNVIPNGLGVKLSADKKNVIIIPKAVESNKNYKIVISRYFKDAEGQGLTRNSTETVLDLNVGDFAAFSFKGLSQNSVSGFSQGRNVKVTAEFSMNIDETMVKEGIVVKNTENGEEIPYGVWSYSYAVDENDVLDYKKIVLDFTNLPTANYIVTTDADFAIGEESLEEAFILEINQVAQPIVLFEEDFETGYTKDENWVNGANTPASYLDSDGKTYYTYGDWDIELDGTANESDFVGVVAASSDMANSNMKGNVLKVNNDRATAYNNGWTAFRRNFENGGISLTSGEYAGKTLVMEADLYAPKVAWETSAWVVSRNKASLRDYTATGAFTGLLTDSGKYRLTSGSYADAKYGAQFMWRQEHYTQAVYKTPNKIRIAFDQSSEVDTVRLYDANGSIVKVTTNKVLDGHKFNGIPYRDIQGAKYQGQGHNFGDTLYGVWALASNNTMYFDNMKVYLVDPFEVEKVQGASNVFNPAKASVTYTFTKPVNPESVSGSVVLLDEQGNEIAGGIKSATLADGNYQMIVKLADSLQGNAKYTIVLKETLTDADNLSLATKYYYYDTYNIDDHYEKLGESGTWTDIKGNTYNNAETYVIGNINHIYKEATASSPATLTAICEDTKKGTVTKREAPIDGYVPDWYATKEYVDIKTSKATSLYAEATKAEIDGATVKTKVTLTNPEIEEMEVWCVVAAYGEYDKLLGCYEIKQTVEPGARVEGIDVTFTAKNANIKTVKMFVWNNDKDVKPYHKAEVLK